MIVRAIGPSDVPALAALLTDAIDAGWSIASTEDELKRPGALALGAFGPGLVGAVVGFSVVDELEISLVAVERCARRAGIGRALVDAALNVARGRGVARAFLEVRASNVAARTLYERAGFIVAGQRAKYYRDGEDACSMERAL